ncbi:MAG: 4-alpha-glucanotransferase, partial [Leptospira sp.]|nr:4-alpha-glucanotransferase [Leptospira sp.]
KSIRINHNRIKDLKIKIFREYFETNNTSVLLKECEAFIQNHSWLSPYIAFKIIYEKYHGLHWQKWKDFSSYSKDTEERIIKENRNEYFFQAWLQMTVFKQLSAIKDEYSKLGIYLKGDMPILTSGNSADVWARGNLFDLRFTAGAPPDHFSSDGQNWGFPIINWDEMKKEKFDWWLQRIRYLENFYHMYRIDHVLGMYRIWAIPLKAKNARDGWFKPQIGVGRSEFESENLNPDDFLNRNIISESKKDKFIFLWDFYKTPEYNSHPEEVKRKLYELSIKHLPEDEKIWKKNGEVILDFLIQNSGMLPCTEDLGAVPEFVRDSIHEKQIIGLDIVRWTKSFENGKFIPPDAYRENAVSSLSVHDTSITLQWWKELSPQEQDSVMEFAGIKKNFTMHQIAEAMLQVALNTKSIFSINILHDFLFGEHVSILKDKEHNMHREPEKHRINIPGSPEEENWGYRFNFYIEDLIEEKELNLKIRKMIEVSKRI